MWEMIEDEWEMIEDERYERQDRLRMSVSYKLYSISVRTECAK